MSRSAESWGLAYHLDEDAVGGLDPGEWWLGRPVALVRVDRTNALHHAPEAAAADRASGPSSGARGRRDDRCSKAAAERLAAAWYLTRQFVPITTVRAREPIDGNLRRPTMRGRR